jgi:N-hydroxyarylamine O-acetyltransferase
MELREYLDRIGYSGPVEPTFELLRDLHRQHLYAIPFENLDIALKQEITLDLERVYEKIVQRGRGGFCYEHNGLFAWALRKIGFDVDILSARVARADGGYGRDFDHMLLLVRIDGEPWVADVGFGDSFIEPLRFVVEETQEDRGLDYQIVREADGYLLRRREATEWKKQFLFTTEPRHMHEFTPMCVWQQTSPESAFTHKRVCSRATPAGRVTLTDTTLIVTEDGKRTETPVESVEEFERLLRQHFRIELTGLSALAG